MTDHIDEKSRGKWESFNSITTAGWCGSAMLGGWICDQYGYGTTFYVTVILQFFGTILLIPVLFKEK
jgi:predicted MFS family arabinose efflux permease